MVVKMMKWRPWPPLVSRKYEVRLIVRRLDGCDLVWEGEEKGSSEVRRFTVEIRWKGPKLALSSLRRTAVRRNFTREVDVNALAHNGLVEWAEEFQSLCNLSAYKDNVFHPWEIAFTVFNGLNQGPKNKVPVVGTALLNLAELASAADKNDFELNIPLRLPGGAVEASSSPSPSLYVLVSLLELRASQESTDPVQRSIVPVPSPPCSGETALVEKGELSAIKAGLRKVKIFTEYVSTRKAKKACCEEEGSEGRCSAKSDDGDCNYPFDSDSLDDYEEGESEEGKEDSTVRKSFSYGTLPYANYAGESFYSSMMVNGSDEDWVFCSNRKSDVGCLQHEDSAASVSEQSVLQSSKRSILPWRKRKLSFRSPKAKGEPLLKKAYGEEGGDDIDFDRRQLSSDESSTLGMHKPQEDSSANRSSVSEFGDDSFAIGSWERKEVTSRDGHLKLQTQVFFASIDQRSEQAAGESACTALVAVIADWFQNNHNILPIKSQFDSLIREGSLEWRNLCENETYKQQFPDKHFDLDTVIQAKIRPLSVFPGKSFIGFFHPEGMDEGRFDFLHGAMSFDNIWDEISHAGSECPSNGEPWVYIVSWNDHFFILKVESDAYFIIDTLGERLYEGCNQAYILKFDNTTVIYKMPNVAQPSDEKASSDKQIVAAVTEPNNTQAQEPSAKVGSVAGPEEPLKGEQDDEALCEGKESCKEYIKSFLAAIPIREMLADIKKGLMASTPLHHRLQIEFHYTQLLKSLSSTLAAEVSATSSESIDVAVAEVSP
ncbi:EEIG1/EHBP1 N-terminal domain containing protein [Quillaja saponaria]|uniref:EEIG1/EHBP1 N-terminal domain containing protein n=1 Tax=Quillaja saponaria TaxID=32244 RepID=A0AAD7VHV4_QUISA|nr:EEIG1/EHBP1 N-terminal domain containing protein [Quillaja saponaria]